MLLFFELVVSIRKVNLLKLSIYPATENVKRHRVNNRISIYMVILLQVKLLVKYSVSHHHLMSVLLSFRPFCKKNKDSNRTENLGNNRVSIKLLHQNTNKGFLAFFSPGYFRFLTLKVRQVLLLPFMS